MTEQEKQQIRKAQRVYMKAWRAKNKDKVRANNQRYWLRRFQQEAGKEAATDER